MNPSDAQRAVASFDEANGLELALDQALAKYWDRLNATGDLDSER